METIIGREQERSQLTTALQSNHAELIAVYGRRRIGKTFLIRNHFHANLLFELTGIHNASLKIQLHNFSLALKSLMGLPVAPATPLHWMDAFQQLSDVLDGVQSKRPMVIFFDELPWLSTKRSGFLEAFGHWWNTWASRNPRVKVVICGSAASWMIRKVINDRGGLHNRVTLRIRLLPFSLFETEQFLIHQGVKLDRYQILQLYMALGGIPPYLMQVQKGDSSAQTIDKLCFAQQGMLKSEFSILFQSLFAQAANHEKVVRILSKKLQGMTRREVIDASGFTTGGWTTELFDELEQSGFITQYRPYGRSVRDAVYRVSDEYCLFYFKFIEGARATGSGTWLRLSQTQSYTSWSGFAFEAVCLKHVEVIRHALGISGVYTEASTWRYDPRNKGEKGAQVDLLLDRADHCINLCEIKFSTGEFTIDKKYAHELDQKVEIFRLKMKVKKTLFLTMVTTFGTKQNTYYTGRVISEATMDDLFQAK